MVAKRLTKVFHWKKRDYFYHNSKACAMSNVCWVYQKVYQKFLCQIYQKIATLLEKASEQPSIFAARDWVEVNDYRRQNYESDVIEIKTSMLQSRFASITFSHIFW